MQPPENATDTAQGRPVPALLWPPDVETALRHVQAQTQGDGSAEYHLLTWGAPDELPVPTTRARDAVDASEAFLPDIAASAPHPLWVDGKPPRPLAPEMRLAIDETGGRYLVGEVEWPGVERTHGVMWGSFTAEELGTFRSEWARMERA